MKRIYVVCEGQTEEEFVNAVLGPALIGLNIALFAEMIETSKGHKGGALRYERVKRHLRNRLRQEGQTTFTTLFDLYRLDTDFPDFPRAKGQPDLATRLSMLNSAFHKNIVSEAKCRPERFIPYIQPYEFEALLFSDVATLVSYEQNWQNASTGLNAALAQVNSPEHINDRPETKPAAQLERWLRDPSYRKLQHGPMVAKQIGLSQIESKCAFFAAWLKKLRALAP